MSVIYGRSWGELGIQTKMLAIILPLVIVPMLVLAFVGFTTTGREAAKSSNRYLAQREADLRALVENPGIPSYFNNTRYGLAKEAEVARQELGASLKRFVERSNSSDRVYHRVRFVDQQGREVASVADGEIQQQRGNAAVEPFFGAVKALRPGEPYVSAIAPAMLTAMPVYRMRAGQPRPSWAPSPGFALACHHARRSACASADGP